MLLESVVEVGSAYVFLHFLRCAPSATRLAFRSFVAYLAEFAPHFVPQAYALSSPSVILDVLNPKMFVKTGVFRHSFSCHFFFCVVFKELFAAIFSVWLRCCSKKFVRVGKTTRSSLFLRCASPYEKSLRKNFCFGFFPNRFALPRNARPRSLLRLPRFSSSRLALRKKSFANASAFAAAKNKMVGLGRLELLTSRLSGVRSNQLSYRPI